MKIDTRKLRIAPKRSLGQHLLINEGVIKKIVAVAGLQPDDTVVEVGPGTGNLTRHLVGRVRRLILIEKDRRLIGPLQKDFGDVPGVEIIEDDVLKLDIENCLKTEKPREQIRDYKILANLPYYITSHFFKTIFSSWPKPKLMVVMVQKEVAQRIVAQPPYMNLLALSVQLYAKPRMVCRVSRGSFRPMPKVDSAIIHLIPKRGIDPEENERVLTIAKRAFAGKRKQLKNTIDIGLLRKTGIKPELRPQNLSAEDWMKIASEV